MKNPRPTKIKSLKGPRRKLELELIDGKRYIKKRDLQYYYFDHNWTIKDFKYHFGLGHRVVRSSLSKWFTPEERKASHYKKISDKQMGSNNSNALNWYRPRKVLPLEVLENAIRSTVNKRDLQRSLGLTSYELSSLQQFYNLKLPNGNTLIDDFGVNHLTKEEILLLAKLAYTFDLYDDLLSSDLRKIHNSIAKLHNIVFELKYINRKLRKYYREIPHNLPTNLIEYQFYKELKKKVTQVIPQYFIQPLNIHVDFLLNDTYILELDGNFHNEEEDKDRDTTLRNMGYTIIRINLDKVGFNKFNTYKSIRQCIKKLILPKLNQ